MTSEVTNLLLKNNFFIVTVPKNITHLFQPLTLTVNDHCKAFLKRKFAQWFVQQFNKQLSLGKRVEYIEMKLHLTDIKPIHAKWITQFYSNMSTEDKSKLIINGWKKSGIFDAVANGSSSLWIHFKPLLRYHNLTVNLVKPSILRKFRRILLMFVRMTMILTGVKTMLISKEMPSILSLTTNNKC